MVLAGQALSSKLPRGLSKLGPLLGAGSGAGAAGLIVAPVAAGKAIPALAAASPRLVGEGAYKVGQGVEAAKSIPVSKVAKVAAPVLRGAYQTGRASDVINDMGGVSQ